MTKRLLILSVLVSAFAVSTGAHAACGGLRNIATVRATSGSDAIDVTIVANTVGGCDDGSLNTTGPLAAPTTLTVTGAESCSAQTTSDWDPFGFGAGVHDNLTANDQCAADISWGGFTSAYSPATDRTDGVYLGKDAGAEGGIVKVNGRTFLTGEVAPGRMYTGVGGTL